MTDQHVPRGAPIFQITQDDLADLERIIPELLNANIMNGNDQRLRVQWITVKKILSDVRWNYGPPTEVEKIPAGGE